MIKFIFDEHIIYSFKLRSVFWSVIYSKIKIKKGKNSVVFKLLTLVSKLFNIPFHFFWFFTNRSKSILLQKNLNQTKHQFPECCPGFWFPTATNRHKG